MRRRVARLGIQSSDHHDLLERGLAVGLTLAAIGVLVLLLWRCRHGIDLSDEGSYLNDIVAPWLYPSSVTQFGSVYHPLYRLLGGDLVLLRQANLALCWGVAAILAYHLLACGATESAADRRVRVCAAVLTGSLAMALLTWWLPAPSYNSLTVQGLCLVALGLVRLPLAPVVREPVRPATPLPAMLIGLGGATTFLGKPSSAAGLAFVTGLVALARSRRPLQDMAVASAVAIAVLIAAALGIDGSVSGFARRLVAGLADGALLHEHYSIGGLVVWERLLLSKDEQRLVVAAGVAALLLGAIMLRLSVAWRLRLLAFGGLAVACGIVVELAGACPLSCRVARWLPGGVQIGLLALPLGLALTMLAAWRIWRTPHSTGLAAGAGALSAALLAFPLVSALGTNSPVWTIAVQSAVFWLLAPLPLIAQLSTGDERRQFALATGIAALAVTVLVCGRSMEEPYRQPSALRLQSELVRLQDPGRTLLRVDGAVAQYLRALISGANAAGFGPGTPMLDMTGAHPGTLLALGARAIGMSWMIGGYSGSTAFVGRVLGDVPCGDMARAWVLSAPHGPRALDAAVLARHGLAFPDDYVEVARVAAVGNDAEHVLWRPAAAAARVETNCAIARARTAEPPGHGTAR